MKAGILLACYGAANPESRNDLRFFSEACQKRFPKIPVRWAFTSPAVRDKLAARRQKSDSLSKALLRFHYEKFTGVAVQPLHFIQGHEYEEARRSVEQAALETGLACELGLPLLNSAEDSEKAAKAVAERCESFCEEGEAIFMAHGAKHVAGAMYSHLAKAVSALNPKAHVAAMSCAPFLEDVLPGIASKKVFLFPLLAFVGLHATRDMAGDHENSWKRRVESRGIECQPILRGMAQTECFSRLWLDNLEAALAKLLAKGGK